MRWWRPLTIVLLACASAGCVFHLKESHLVRPSPSPATALPVLAAEFPQYTLQERRIETPGASLYSLRFLHPQARATVLYFGGNGFRVPLHARYGALAYAGVPVNLVLVDHRGYGGSTGEVSLAAMRDDAVVAYDAVRADAGFHGVPVIVHGQSIGSFLAGSVAARRRLDGLVLESSMTDARDWVDASMAKRGFWSRLAIRRVDIDPVLASAGNLDVVRALDEPVLFVVGADDTATAPEFSRRLYDATPLAPPDKQLLVVPGKGHNDASRSDDFHDAMRAFVERVAPASAGERAVPRLLPDGPARSPCHNARGGVGQAVASPRVLRCPSVPRKVRAPQGTVPGNAWAARADGKCNRKIPPNGPSGCVARVKWCGKSAPRAWQQAGTANPTGSKTK